MFKDAWLIENIFKNLEGKLYIYPLQEIGSKNNARAAYERERDNEEKRSYIWIMSQLCQLEREAKTLPNQVTQSNWSAHIGGANEHEVTII